MKTALLLLLAGASALTTPGARAAEGDSPLDAVIARKVLNVCTTGDYRPFSYRPGETGEFVGIDIDLARSLAASLEAEPMFVHTKWSDLLGDFQTKCDVAMSGISVTLARQKVVAFSQMYLVNGKAPIVRCADVSKYDSVEEINEPGVRVIVNPGGTSEKYAKASFDEAEIRMFPDNRTIFQEILDGRADVMVAESVEVKLQEKLHPGLCAVNPDQPLQNGEMGIMLPRGDEAFKAYVDQWLHLAKATGEFDRIVDGNMK